MSAALERHYTRLLRLYPAGYRQARGGELLETLLESAADQGRRRPSLRETGSLVLGALRVRAGNTRRSVADSWLSAARAAALMLLVYATANAAGYLSIGYGASRLLESVPIVLSGCAIVSVLRHRYRFAFVAAAAAFVVAAVMHLPERGFSFGDFWQPPLAALLLLPLWWRRPQRAAGLLNYLPLGPLLLVAIEFGAVPVAFEVLQVVLVLALLGLALFWAAVDERVTMAVGLFCLTFVFNQVTFEMGTGGHPRSTPAVAVLQIGIVGILPTLFLLLSAFTVRRQARL